MSKKKVVLYYADTDAEIRVEVLYGCASLKRWFRAAFLALAFESQLSVRLDVCSSTEETVEAV